MAVSVKLLELTYILRCTRPMWDNGENNILINAYLTASIIASERRKLILDLVRINVKLPVMSNVPISIKLCKIIIYCITDLCWICNIGLSV